MNCNARDEQMHPLIPERPILSLPEYIKYITVSLYTRVYPNVSGLANWLESCKWYKFLPLATRCSFIVIL